MPAPHRFFELRQPPAKGVIAPEEKDKASAATDDAYLCGNCLAAITTTSDESVRNGRHRHALFNPAGVLFEIGCFAKAPGCALYGEATDEFSWFAGFMWRYALCANCHTHLGWFYEKSDSSFFGLILPELRGPRQR